MAQLDVLLYDTFGPETEEEWATVLEGLVQALEEEEHVRALEILRGLGAISEDRAEQVLGQCRPHVDTIRKRLLHYAPSISSQLRTSAAVREYIRDYFDIDENSLIKTNSTNNGRVDFSSLFQFESGTDNPPTSGGEMRTVLQRSTHTQYVFDFSAVPRESRTLLDCLAELGATQYAPFFDASTLNPVQLKALPAVFKSTSNILISAPTGTGKTFVALLAIVRELISIPSEHHLLMVYVAPLKSLVREVVHKFRRAFGAVHSLNAQVLEFTGDAALPLQTILDRLGHLRLLLLVATPEKLDSLTSKVAPGSLRRLLRLVIIDEVHLLGESERGPVLELLIVRLLRHYQARLLALSATVPNAAEVGAFLRCDSEAIVTCDASYRAVSLRVHVCSVETGQGRSEYHARFSREKVLRELLPQHSTLVFVHSRREAERMALVISGWQSDKRRPLDVHPANKQLQTLTEMGGFVLFHHAGLIREDRELVEDLFLSRRARIVVCTATLAWGVNTPARSIFILGTRVYHGGIWTELGYADIFQMLGRAGRPGYDTEGEGYLLASSGDVERCIGLFSQSFRVQSRLCSQYEALLRFIISEIQLDESCHRNTLEMALDGTLLALQTKDFEMLRTLIQQTLDATKDVGIVKDEAGRYSLTHLARLALQFYVDPVTVLQCQSGLRNARHPSLLQLILILSSLREFEKMPLRTDEQFEVEAFLAVAPFSLSFLGEGYEGLKKVAALLQMVLSTGPCYGTSATMFRSLSLMSDYQAIEASLGRVVGCMLGVARTLPDLPTLLAATQLQSAITTRCWPQLLPVRQVYANVYPWKERTVADAIPQRISQALGSLEKLDLQFADVRTLTAKDLAEIVEPSAAEEVYALVSEFPEIRVYDLSVRYNEEKETTILCEVSFTIALYGDTRHMAKDVTGLELSIYVSGAHTILAHRLVFLALGEEVHSSISIAVPYEIRLLSLLVLSQDIMGIECYQQVHLDDLHVECALVRRATNRRLPWSSDLTAHRQLLLASHDLYVDGRKQTISILRVYASERTCILVGLPNGDAPWLAKEVGLTFISVLEAHTTFQEETTLIVPDLMELEEYEGYMLELFLIKARDSRLLLLSPTLIDSCLCAIQTWLPNVMIQTENLTMITLTHIEASSFEDVFSSQRLLQQLREASVGSTITVPQHQWLSSLTLTSRLLSSQAIFTLFSGLMSETGLQDQAISDVLDQVYGKSYMLSHLMQSPMAYGLDYGELHISLPTLSNEDIARCQERLYEQLSAMISRRIEAFEEKYMGRVIEETSEQHFLLSEALRSMPHTTSQDKKYSTTLLASIHLAPCYVPTIVQERCGILVPTITTYLERLQLDLMAHPYASSLLQCLSRSLDSHDTRQEATTLSILLLYAVTTNVDFPLMGLPAAWVLAARSAVLEAETYNQ